MFFYSRTFIYKVVVKYPIAALVSIFLLLRPLSLYSQSRWEAEDMPNVDLTKQIEATKNFIIPIESYNGFAGTYGELRGNHFHCGLDMRTAGVEGRKIYAADDGYVCRITVTPSGFGNMIMVAHPSGYKTIYGHLQKFAKKYQEYVRNKQYEEESWYQEIDFEPNEFPVKRGDLIAYSGNTGSSGGPHLHFEVRDSDGVPVNLQLSNTYNLVDKTKPIIRDVKFVGFSNVYGVDYTFPIQIKSEKKYVTKQVVKKNSKGKKYTVNQKVEVKQSDDNIVVNVPSSFYVAIDAYDLMDGSPGKLAIYKYEVFLDDSRIFSFSEGNIPYSTGSYIASLLDHRLRLQTGKYYVKSLLDPYNELQNRVECINRGVIEISDDNIHLVKIKVTDVLGNSTTKQYKVKLDKSLYSNKIPLSVHGEYIDTKREATFATEGLQLTFPEGSLYSPIHLDVAPMKTLSSPYSTQWLIGDRNIPLHRSVTMVLRANLPDSLAHKALIARKNDNGTLVSVGGVYNNFSKSITATFSSFGTYLVAVDTIAPKATFKFADNQKIASNSIKIIIGDNLSGIKRFRVEVDGHWVVAEHDAKTSSLNIPLDDARIKKGIKHALTLYLIDNKLNEAKISRNFIW